MDRISLPLTPRPHPSLAQRLRHAFAKIGLAARSADWTRIAAAGLNPTQLQVLELLAAYAPSALRLREVAAALAVTPASASDSVAALFRKRLIRKTRCAQDGRAIRIELSPAGRKALVALERTPPLLDGVSAALSPSEQALLLRALLKLIRELQLAQRISVTRMCLTCDYFRPHAHADLAQPHHCELVGAAFSDADLRVDCSDHVPASPADESLHWNQFIGGAT